MKAIDAIDALAGALWEPLWRRIQEATASNDVQPHGNIEQVNEDEEDAATMLGKLVADYYRNV
jgi:hypothetical protein